ncbi:glycosyltransferase family 4 protein [Blastococcus sp. TBT05-19]|uniref:glycosyltransferase n=1 Tax=Blastococcus sp. TBT05-19 TaxID=2250581 RepID=UPI000DEACD6C|nr:glycosyltransferase [Blastococcus sp. TBT05-19]RBY90217.1 glycosyltransferase family 4 protein [Blastococcus sp. TBT05-19]
MRDLPSLAAGRPGRRLTIAVLGPSSHPVAEPYPGGLESFTGGLVAGLRDRGHRVLLFAAAGSTGAQPEVLAGGGWRPDELSRADPSMPAEAFMTEHHAHLNVLDALRTTYAGQVDVVHNNSLHYLPLSLATTLPVPTVTSLHTPPTPWLTAALSAGGGSHAFTTVSRFTARQWEPWVPRAEVLHNGVDPDRWALGRGGGGLLWFGRMVPEKAPHLAIAAAAEAGRHLHLVGPVADAGYFAAQIAPHLGAGATWHGHLGGATLARAVGRADAVLVTPAWDEPFGLVAAEAAMCGTPVVAFDRGGISEVLRPHVGQQVGIVVPAGDVAAMAAAIGPTTALDRRAVREAALSHLSAKTMVLRYEAVLRAAAAEGPATDQVRVAAS